MRAPILNSWLQPVWTWVWQTSLAATVLIGLVLLLQFCFRKGFPARGRYALWLLVLLRLLMPLSPASNFSIFNLGEKPFGSIFEVHAPPQQTIKEPTPAPRHNPPKPLQVKIKDPPFSA